MPTVTGTPRRSRSRAAIPGSRAARHRRGPRRRAAPRSRRLHGRAERPRPSARGGARPSSTRGARRLGRLHVGLVEGVDAEQRPRHGRGELPPEDLGRQSAGVDRRRAAPRAHRRRDVVEARVVAHRDDQPLVAVAVGRPGPARRAPAAGPRPACRSTRRPAARPMRRTGPPSGSSRVSWWPVRRPGGHHRPSRAAWLSSPSVDRQPSAIPCRAQVRVEVDAEQRRGTSPNADSAEKRPPMSGGFSTTARNPRSPPSSASADPGSVIATT